MSKIVKLITEFHLYSVDFNIPENDLNKPFHTRSCQRFRRSPTDHWQERRLGESWKVHRCREQRWQRHPQTCPSTSILGRCYRCNKEFIDSKLHSHCTTDNEYLVVIIDQNISGWNQCSGYNCYTILLLLTKTHNSQYGPLCEILSTNPNT